MASREALREDTLPRRCFQHYNFTTTAATKEAATAL
jgi:hypothetical protein